jgi:hypothetical protein
MKKKRRYTYRRAFFTHLLVHHQKDLNGKEPKDIWQEKLKEAQEQHTVDEDDEIPPEAEAPEENLEEIE